MVHLKDFYISREPDMACYSEFCSGGIYIPTVPQSHFPCNRPAVFSFEETPQFTCLCSAIVMHLQINLVFPDDKYQELLEAELISTDERGQRLNLLLGATNAELSAGLKDLNAEFYGTTHKDLIASLEAGNIWTKSKQTEVLKDYDFVVNTLTAYLSLYRFKSDGSRERVR